MINFIDGYVLGSARKFATSAGQVYLLVMLL